MIDALTIDEVVRRTGLTSRALRFYEARGLLAPLRTASGRRLFGPGELARIHQIVTLKQAGLTLVQIKRLLDRQAIDLTALLQDRLTALAALAREVDVTRVSLRSALSRIEQGEQLDVATLCSLIKEGEAVMANESAAWKALSDKYMSEEAKADFAAVQPKAPPGFDRETYSAQWQELGARIKAALPLDPASDAALAFVREWFTLLAPFTAVATPAMWEGSAKIYANMDQWQGQSAADPGFDHQVWQFIQSATSSARAASKDIGPAPAWMKG